MINLNKMDDHDFVFVNKPLSAKEEKEFSDFLKERKAKVKKIVCYRKLRGQRKSWYNEIVIIGPTHILDFATIDVIY